MRTRERDRDRLPHERRIRRRQVRHVAACLVPPRPEIVDTFFACAGERRLELGDLLARETEARHPELGADAVPRAGLCEESREAPDERPGRLAPMLPVRIGRKGRQPGKRGDRVPVGDAVRPIGRRQEADRVRTAVRGDVGDHLAQEVDHRRLAKRTRVRQLGREIASEALATVIAAAAPARLVLDADVNRNDPGRLVPEDRVDTGLERGRRPLLAERAIRRAVQARGRDPAPVVHHLAFLGVECDPPALRLAAERPAEAPRAHLHRQSDVVRGRDDLGERPAVVGEVVLGERVQHPGIAARREVGHVPPDVADHPYSEVRATDARGARLEGHLCILSHLTPVVNTT